MTQPLIMTRFVKGMLGAGLLLMIAIGASAFSLLGPLKDGDNPSFNAQGINDPWQGAPYDGRPSGLGYSLGGDIGGPMLPTEAYRWNIPIITYAFDSTFLNYFGPNGVVAVEEAIAILNALPAATDMTPSLSEFALDTKAENQPAAALGLRDLKSTALTYLLEQMGLMTPERFVWGLRGRVAVPNVQTNYSVIQLNYDPLTIQPSRYVNGVLYNYQIFDAIGPVGGEWASAVEWFQLDPLFQPYSSVAGGQGSPDLELGSSPDLSGVGIVSGLSVGEYYTGLTRDDAGGLRYLLSTNLMAYESLMPTVLPRSSSASSSPWAPFIGGTNLTGTNINLTNVFGTNITNFVRTALRPGVNKIEFRRVNLIGTNFTPVTIRYTDRFVAPNGRIRRQSVERLVLEPDIIFDVRDIGNAQGAPVIISRTDTGNWTNNAALNSFLGPAGLGGPGTINPPIVITFTDMVPVFLNFIEGGGDIDATGPLLWGSFDGDGDPPVVYPVFQHPLFPELSLQYLRDTVLRRRQ